VAWHFERNLQAYTLSKAIFSIIGSVTIFVGNGISSYFKNDEKIEASQIE
jgi:hypothetical protein